MSWLKNKLARLFERRGVLLPAWKEKTGEKPEVTFATLVDVYVRDPSVHAAVDFLSDQIAGGGFYTSADDPEAKQVVDDFNEKVNLDGLLMQTTREVIGFGNSFWEKVEPKDLHEIKILPLVSISKIKRDEYGRVEYYKQAEIRYKGAELEPERIIHFKWNPIESGPFGVGLLQSLVLPLKIAGETRSSLIEMKAKMEEAMTSIISKYAGPTEIWRFPGLKEDKVTEVTRKVKDLPREGARFVTSIKEAKVDVVATDPRGRFGPYVEHIWNQFILGLETPLPKLFTTPGFTEASAKAALELAERKVLSMQRFLKRIIEREVFWVVLKQSGYDPAQANVRLNWGMPEKPDIEALLPVLTNIARDRPEIIKTSEFRKLLIDMGLPLEKEEEAEGEESEL